MRTQELYPISKMNSLPARPGWSAFPNTPCLRVGSKMNPQPCSLWRLANPCTSLISNISEIPNSHKNHRPLYEFCVSITPKPEQQTSTIRCHLMWPHRAKGLTWLKLRAMLSILLCSTNSQFNNKTLNKKMASAAYIAVWMDKIKSHFFLLLCYDKIEPELEAWKGKKKKKAREMLKTVIFVR